MKANGRSRRSWVIGAALLPWEVLSASAKVEVLDRLLRREIEKALPKLLAEAK